MGGNRKVLGTRFALALRVSANRPRVLELSPFGYEQAISWSNEAFTMALVWIIYNEYADERHANAATLSHLLLASGRLHVVTVDPDALHRLLQNFHTLLDLRFGDGERRNEPQRVCTAGDDQQAPFTGSCDDGSRVGVKLKT